MDQTPLDEAKLQFAHQECA